MPGKGALMDVQRDEYSHLPIVEGKIGQGVKFERIRRISGYLVGTTDRWNNAKNHMNTYDLVKQLRKECSLTEAEAEKLIKAAIDTFTEALAEGERVFLPGFGTFAPVARAARKGRNPKTGEELSLPACNAIKFTAAKRLKDAMNR